MLIIPWDRARRLHIPTLESFSIVVEECKQRLPIIGGVCGGLILGSALRGAHTPMSDVDLMVMAHSYTAFMSMKQNLKELRRFANLLHVPLNIQVILRDEAIQGLHDIPRSYWLHLSDSELLGGRIGESIVDSLNMDSYSTAHVDVTAWVARRLRKIRQWMVNDPSSQAEICERLSKILSLAMPLCLKMMYVDDETYREAGNASLLKDYQDRFSSPRARDSLRLLLEWKGKCCDVLTQFQTDPQEWQNWYPLASLDEKDYNDFMLYALTRTLDFEHIFLQRNLEYLLSMRAE